MKKIHLLIGHSARGLEYACGQVGTGANHICYGALDVDLSIRDPHWCANCAVWFDAYRHGQTIPIAPKLAKS